MKLFSFRDFDCVSTLHVADYAAFLLPCYASGERPASGKVGWQEGRKEGKREVGGHETKLTRRDGTPTTAKGRSGAALQNLLPPFLPFLSRFSSFQ